MIVRRHTAAVVLVLLFVAPIAAYGAAEGDPDVIVFYREGCNDCRHMDAVLDELTAVYPELRVAHVEESEPGAADLMWTLAGEYGIFPTAFPVIFVGDRSFVGVGRDKEILLRSAVQFCVFNDCDTPLSRLESEPIPWMTILLAIAGAMVAALLLFA